MLCVNVLVYHACHVLILDIDIIACVMTLHHIMSYHIQAFEPTVFGLVELHGPNGPYKTHLKRLVCMP